MTTILRISLFATLVSPFLFAQSDVGRIVGTITDSSGAVIPKATVKVKNEKTSRSQTVEPNEQGRFVAAQLPPAPYTVKAEAAGMSPAEFSGVIVQVGQDRTLNITLQPSTVTTEVNVSGGDLAVIDVSSVAVGSNISAREVAELPINGRQISQLYLMAPGAVNFGPGTFDDIRFNGRSF